MKTLHEEKNIAFDSTESSSELKIKFNHTLPFAVKFQLYLDHFTYTLNVLNVHHIITFKGILSLLSWRYTLLSKFLLEFVQMKDKDHFTAKILYYLHRITPPPPKKTPH